MSDQKSFERNLLIALFWMSAVIYGLLSIGCSHVKKTVSSFKRGYDSVIIFSQDTMHAKWITHKKDSLGISDFSFEIDYDTGYRQTEPNAIYADSEGYFYMDPVIKKLHDVVKAVSGNARPGKIIIRADTLKWIRVQHTQKDTSSSSTKSNTQVHTDEESKKKHVDRKGLNIWGSVSIWAIAVIILCIIVLRFRTIIYSFIKKFLP